MNLNREKFRPFTAQGSNLGFFSKAVIEQTGATGKHKNMCSVMSHSKHISTFSSAD